MMTVVQSLLTSKTFEIRVVEAEAIAMQYHVMVCKRHNPRDVLYGTVVSHLSLEDWCDLKGMCLIQSYPQCTRVALPSERTDLF